MAGTQNLALAKGHVPKGEAGNAALRPTEGGKLSLINEVPLLHETTLQHKYTCTSTGMEELSKVVALVAPARRHCRLTLS